MILNFEFGLACGFLLTFILGLVFLSIQTSMEDDYKKKIEAIHANVKRMMEEKDHGRT